MTYFTEVEKPTPTYMQPQKALNSQIHVREKNKQGYQTS